MRNVTEVAHPKESDEGGWIGLQVSPGEGLADSAAQHGVIGVGAFRALEKQFVGERSEV